MMLAHDMVQVFWACMVVAQCAEDLHLLMLSSALCLTGRFLPASCNLHTCSAASRVQLFHHVTKPRSTCLRSSYGSLVSASTTWRTT